MSVTAAAVNAGPVVVKDKKTAIIIMKDVKTKFFKHQHKLHSHHHKWHHHHHSKDMDMKKMDMKKEPMNKMGMNKKGRGIETDESQY
jgi:hypothetical protein